MTTTAAENLPGRGVEKKDEKEKMEKRKALGRGLESLLRGPRVVAPPVQGGGDSSGQQVPRLARNDKMGGGDLAALEPAAAGETEATGAGAPAPREQIEVISIQAQASPGNLVVNLDVDLIEKNPYQTRYIFDEEQLIELRDSIKEHGVVQPVVVRPAEEAGRYILVLGERRLRASKMAGKQTVPALVRRLSPQQAAEMTLLENVMREDLNPIEQAEAYRVLSQEFKLTQAQIAQRIGVSRESVSNYMRLLRLPEEIKQYVAHGRLGFSEAREMLSLENPEHILLLAEEVLTRRLRWDEIKDRVARLNGSWPPLPEAEKQNRGARWMDPNVRAAQMEMERTLGMRVRIKDRNGKGRIVIEYASVDDYGRVVDMLRKK
jgi:ParB family transcriptional regulator, chromosome partitioning protein